MAALHPSRPRVGGGDLPASRLYLHMEEPHAVPEPGSLLASGRAHEYNPLCARKSPHLLLEMERSLRGTDEKPDRDDERSHTAWTSAWEIPGCAAADSVQFMTYLWHKYILFMAHMA